jgi:hypothetical protein
MRTARVLIAFALSALPVHAHPAPGAARQQFRCEVLYFSDQEGAQGRGEPGDLNQVGGRSYSQV